MAIADVDSDMDEEEAAAAAIAWLEAVKPAKLLAGRFNGIEGTEEETGRC
jgi:hypothetical protein